MRIEWRESPVKFDRRREYRTSTSRRRPLEPQAVDAAMDEPLPATELCDDAELLKTISQQLDLLREQERSIRRLLDRAGHRRVDGANA